MFVSMVDNTFSDPCRHVEQSPKLGPSAADLATALAAIPNTTATDPMATTIAGLEATYIELTIGSTLPCTPEQMYLWQDSPGGYYWALGTGELMRVWIVEVDGRRLAIASRSYPGTGDAARAELPAILDSLLFGESL